MKRIKVASLIFIGLLLIFLPSLKQSSLVQANNALEKDLLVSLVNENRVLLGISELKENPLLTESAQRKAEDMTEKSYFSHTCPEGVTPWHWFDEVGYDYRFAGENLAVNFWTNKDLFDSWMNSSTHRGNILNESYSEIGTGIAYGYYNGKRGVFVVQHFGITQESSASEKNFNEITVQEELNNLLKRIEDLKFLLTN